MITSTNDSGPGTLREALTNLVEGDFLWFDASLGGQTITLTSRLPDVSVSVQIAGPSGNPTTIDAVNTYSFFNVTGSSVTIEELNFVNGVRGAQAGAIEVANEILLDLIKCSITPSSSMGGAFPIYLNPGSTLQTEGLIFSTNMIPNIYFDQAMMEIKSSTMGTSSYVIDGSGIVSVKDGEIARLNTASEDSVDMQISAETGTIIFNGNNLGPCLSNVSTGSLYGTYTAGYVANAGTMQPGDNATIGIDTITTEWGQTEEGLLKIKLNPSGGVDLIQCGEYANIDGALELHPASGFYAQGTTYTFLSSNPSFGIIGTFDTVTSTANSLQFSVRYNLFSVQIEIINDCSVP